MIKQKKYFMVLMLVGSCLLSSVAVAATYTMNFKDADIKELIKFVADATGYTVIIDPKVKGNINLISNNEVDEEEMYGLFLSVLQANNYAAIKNGNVLRIIPNRQARASSTPVVKKPPQGLNANFETQIIELQNVDATKLIPVLRPLVPQQGHMAAYADSNSIIIADTADNIKKIYDVIQILDKSTVNKLEVFKLKHSSADEFVTIINKVLKSVDSGGKKSGFRLASVVADKRSNSLIVTGSSQQRAKIKDLIERLDGPLESLGNAQVFSLKYANAKDLAPVLTKVSKSLSELSAPAASSGGNNRVSSVSIEADEATNSLIITASGEVMKGIHEIIKRLDVLRPQVLVEVIIAEITLGDVRSLGINWLVAEAGKGFAGSNNSSQLAGLVRSGAFSNDKSDSISGLGKALTSAAGGVFGGLNFDINGASFAGLISALETNSETNILSTPSIMTLDNNEAIIVVGQEIPLVTGSFTSTGGGGSSTSNPGNPFQTIERKDVGITLKVTPHVNAGGLITLDISQEVSGIEGAASEISSGRVVTNERKIVTKVAIGDGETIVLGGLIRDEVQETVSKIPILGDIPLIGRLFKTSTTNVRKTNLMIFIRPTIVSTSARVSEISEKRYRAIRESQLYKKMRGVDLFDEDVLPDLPTWEERAEDLDKIRKENETIFKKRDELNATPININATMLEKDTVERQQKVGQVIDDAVQKAEAVIAGENENDTE